MPIDLSLIDCFSIVYMIIAGVCDVLPIFKPHFALITQEIFKKKVVLSFSVSCWWQKLIFPFALFAGIICFVEVRNSIQCINAVLHFEQIINRHQDEWMLNLQNATLR